MASLILDKNAVQGARADTLVQASREHQLLLPAVFFYEVATQEKPTPRWRSFYEKLRETKPGACCSPEAMIREELACGLPVEDVVDRKVTEELHAALRRGVDTWPEPWTVISPEDYRTDVEKSVSYMRNKVRDVWTRSTARQAAREYGALLRSSSSRAEAIGKIKDATRSIAEHEWKAAGYAKGLATERSVAFMGVWVRNCQCFVLAADSGQAHCGAKDSTLFNLCLDRHYVLHLVGAQGIVSADPDVVDLATAFFPSALVFSSVAEVVEQRGA